MVCMTTRLLIPASCLSVAFLGGCGGGSDGPKCIAGASVACECPSGQQGAQTCNSTGTFGVCVCASPTPDAGVSAGAGGTGGTPNIDGPTSTGGAAGTGGLIGTGGSSVFPPSSICGNGALEPGESCDCGTDPSKLPSGCKAVNGLFYDDGKGCSKTCAKEPSCLDASGKTQACTTVCGDGNLDPGEECDDANVLDGDGCSSSCEIEGGFTCST